MSMNSDQIAQARQSLRNRFPLERVNVIFTRHSLTATQMQEIRGERIFDAAASKTIASKAEARQIVWGWIEQALALPTEVGTTRTELRVYGVPPPIVRAVLTSANRPETGGVILRTFEAHNINRAADGKPPQFEFSGWMLTGEYTLSIQKELWEPQSGDSIVSGRSQTVTDVWGHKVY